LFGFFLGAETGLAGLRTKEPDDRAIHFEEALIDLIHILHRGHRQKDEIKMKTASGRFESGIHYPFDLTR
jgi:hypothetical protein